MRVAAEHPAALGAFGRRIEMHDLNGRVHTCIGATGRVDCDGMIGDSAQRRLDGVLHARRVLLRLPAGEAATVVFETEGEPRHGRRPGGLWAVGLLRNRTTLRARAAASVRLQGPA